MNSYLLHRRLHAQLHKQEIPGYIVLAAHATSPRRHAVTPSLLVSYSRTGTHLRPTTLLLALSALLK
jgi:hypothetical protein